MIPLYLTDEETRNFRSYIVDYINANFSYDFWITTRFDNDDSVSKSFIQTLQENIDYERIPYVLSYPDGYQYDLKHNVLCKYHFPNNHFTSYITSKKDMTVYDFGHINLISQNDTVYLKKDEPMWIEIIHGQNVYNRMGTINPKNYVKAANLIDEFGCNIKTALNIFQLGFYYIYFAIKKGWNKRSRIGIYIKRKLHMKYKDDRTDR